MKEIYILGAGGFAKEVHFLIRQIGGYKIMGFIDKKESDPIRINNMDYPVFTEKELMNRQGLSLAIGIGNPALISLLTEKFKDKYLFPNLIHPTVIADWENIKIGSGNILTSSVNMTSGISIGSYNIFNLCCTVGHDTVIGNCNVINPGANISGGTSIADTILIGTNATILQNLSIGKNATVGAASLVTKNVEEDSVVIGVPAKKNEKK